MVSQQKHVNSEYAGKVRSFLGLFLVVVSAFASGGNSFGAQPLVNVVNPPGLQRGTSAEILLAGARLGDAKQILFYTPGIEATSFAVIDDNQVKVTFNVAADASCDLHAFRLVTSTGVSNIRYLGVSPFVSVSEAEPNSEFAAPQTIQLPCTVNGVVLNEDVDYYAVDCSQGTLITVEIEGLRHVHTNNQVDNFFDPFVAILDSKRFELARSDDSALLQQDGICSAVAPADGRYWIEVRESSFGGGPECLYRLHVGSFRRPVAIVPGGGPPGQPLLTTLVDSLGVAWQETFAMPEVANERYRVWSSRDGQALPSPNLIRANNLTNIVEVEPQDDLNIQPVYTTFPIAFNGVLQTKGDRDWFVIEAKKDQSFEMKLYGRKTLRSPIDAVVEVNKLNGPHIVGADDSGGPDSLVNFNAPEDAKYAISVRDHLGNGGPDYSYRLEVEAASPSLELTVAEQQRYVSQTIEVPRGSRMAFQVNLIRKAIGGEGRLTIPDLPPGVTLLDSVVPADLGTIPVIIRAAADAPNIGKLVDFQAQTVVSPELTVVGHLSQRSQMVRGQNEVDVWGHNADRLAVAVTDPAPFDIEIVQPQVPLVRDGTLPLKIRAKRNEGFDKPINVYLLYAPPGVAASGSIAIPGDQSEVDLPLTANGGAGLRTWPITVMAVADTGRGTVKIASEFVMLEVADRLFEFQFNKTMVEQGKPAEVAVGVKLNRPMEGSIEIEVMGMPPGTTIATPKLVLAPGAERVTYAMDVAADARPGNHKTMVCRGTVTSDKGIVTQVNGAIEVQVDIPLPMAPATPAAAPVVAEAPATQPPAAPVEKPLTRLEQLRKQREGKK